MGFVEDLKWWHWIVISLLVGAVLGFINANTPDPPASRVLEPLNFEERLIRPPIDDNGRKIPWISDIVVHPPRPVVFAGSTEYRQMVNFRCIILPGNGGTGRAEPCSMCAPYPYVPNPRGGPGMHPRYPGLTLYRGQEGDTIQSVLTKQYGQSTPQLRKAFVTANFSLFRNATSAAEMTIRPNQVYYLPWNVMQPHSIADFLSDAAKLGYTVSFSYRWMEIPKYVYPVWIFGSFVVIGLIWPTLLRMMIGQGLGRERTQGFDLRGYKPSPTPAAVGAAGPTAEDQQRLVDLEANMLASLKAQQAGKAPAPAAEAAAPPQVAKLSGAAAPASTPAPAPEPEEKSYEGEYYPVDRHNPRRGKK
jgi:hypothetical protein